MNTEDIIKLTKDLFDGVQRRGGEPYFNHLDRVAKSLSKDCPDFMVQAAYLHDAVEDGLITFKELRSKGIDKITIRIVELMTHAPEDSYMEYLNKITVSAAAMMIKIADMVDNLASDPSDKQIEKYRAGINFLASRLVLKDFSR